MAPDLETTVGIASYANVLDQEVASLKAVVKDILKDIGARSELGIHLLSELEQSVMQLHSGLMNMRQGYNIDSMDRVIALEIELDKVELQKVHTKETTARDTLELKKVLWHYWLELQRVEASRRLL